MLRALVAAHLAIALGCGGNPARSEAACGDARVTSTDDARKLDACTTLASLAVSGAAPLDLSALARLERVTGDVSIGPSSQLTSVRGLETLADIGGSLTIGHSFELGGVFLGSLRRVGGRVTVERNMSLTTVSLSRLERVGGSLVVRDNGGLELVDLGALASVGGELHIAGDQIANVLLPSTLEVRGARHIQPGQAPEAGAPTDAASP